MTRTYLIDYASISPDTIVDAIEYAFPKASAIWTDIDEDSFEVEVIGEFDAETLDEVMEPHLYTHPSDWDDCDYECGFDPYEGCYTYDC